jgi:prepilin-type N-terminal cleavage/methylation domain-containing protein
MKTKNEKGFSLLETLVTMSLFLIVLGGVYVMVVHYGDVSRTEHSRLQMQQDSRFMMTHFTQEIKDAGAVLTIAHALAADDESLQNLLGFPYFNGIFPLNHSDYPDGIIVASGDPDAVTFLKEPYFRGDDGVVLTVEDTVVESYVPGKEWEVTPWKNGDKGILLHKDGYLVFEVERITYNTIEMRELFVYYSGLLNAKSGTSASAPVYTDKDPLGTVITGDTLTYDEGLPVIRLAYFAIYLFREVKHPRYDPSERMVRQLIRISDTKEEEDPLREYSTAEYSVISENIYDMQIAYRTFEDYLEDVDPTTPMDPNFHYFAGPGTATDRNTLLSQIRMQRLKQLDLDLVSTTNEFGSRGDKDELIHHTIPPIGDQDTYDMPPGKYNIDIISLIIEPRNYNLYLKR